MPFDSSNASAAGRKGVKNRWKDKNPSTLRTKKFLMVVSEDELKMIDLKTSAEGVSRIEFIVRAIRCYQPKGSEEIKAGDHQ